jgi:hypothetical protein
MLFPHQGRPPVVAPSPFAEPAAGRVTIARACEAARRASGR